MGGISGCRSSDLGDSQMSLRGFLYLLVGLLLGLDVTLSYAGTTVPYRFNGLNVTREGGATHLRGTSPSEVMSAGVTVENSAIRASGSANWYAGTGALLQNGGVTFNAVLPLAATAATVAVSAVRLSPGGLITSAVASYLLTKGIEYAEGQFKTTVPGTSSPAPYNIQSCGVWDPKNVNPALVCDNGGMISLCAWSKPTPNSSHIDYCGNGANFYFVPAGDSGLLACPAGTTRNGSNCDSPASQRPTTEDDWTAARVGNWPDAAMLDLVRNGVALPTDKAQFTPPYKDVPVSDPYVDPVTGKRFQDKARITPSPSNPDQADVQVVKQEVDSDGQPVINSSTGGAQAPEKQEDPCKLNPDASACKPLDEVPDMVIPTQDNPFSLNPVSGFGADNASCPASIHLFNKGGQSIDWSWTQFCTFSQGIRPFVIGFAWLAAIAMVVAVGRRNG